MFRRKHWKIHNLTVPIEKKVTRTVDNREGITKNISHTLRFIDDTKFMASSLLNLVNDLSEEVHKIKCNVNTDTMIKIAKHVELNIGIATAFLNKQILKMI